MELVEVLFWGFCTFIKEWAKLSFLPFAAVLHAIPLNSMPLLFGTLNIISTLAFNRYFITFLFPFIFAVDKFNYWPKPMQIIKFLLAAPVVLFMAPYVFLSALCILYVPIIAPIALAFFTFISGVALAATLAICLFFQFLKPKGDWHINNAFKNPLSHESVLLVFIAAGISMSIKSPMPFFVTVGTILGGYTTIQLKKLLNYLFSGHQSARATTLPATHHVAPLQRNSPPRLPLRHHHISHIPELNNQRDRIQQIHTNFYGSLNTEQNMGSESNISLLVEVLNILENPNNDYLLTRNNNLFLRRAAEQGNWDLVVKLLKKPNVAAHAHCGDWTVLRLAIQHNQWKIVSKFLNLPILTNTPMTAEKSDTLNRLIHQITIQNKIHIMNQVIHSQAYNLFDAQAKFNFLLFSIEHNIYTAIIKSLNDLELVEGLTAENLSFLLKNISDDQIARISSQCDFFLTYIKPFMIGTSLTVYGLSVAHLINIDSFNSLKKITFFFKNPLQFLESKTQHAPHLMIAMNLLSAKNTYLDIKNARQEYKESAQDATEVIMANELFETVKNHYQKLFDSKKTVEHSSLDVIEREIKTYLLEQILAEANENIKKQKDIKISTKIINIIDLNKKALLEGEISVNFTLVRAFNKLIPDKISAEQIAWLSYSATHDIDQNNWKFLVQPTEESIVHSTAESAQVSEQAITNVIASQIIRERIAYYWLAVTDENYPDEDDFRIGNFIGVISSIYQTYGFGQSCCYPGHLTDIAKMGMRHPIAEPTTLENLIEQAIIAPVIQATKDTLEENLNWCAEDKENFLSSITYIHEKNAEEIFHSEQSLPIDTQMYHAFTKQRSFIIDSVFDEILKHQRYHNRKISLNEREEIKKGIEYKLLAMASNQYIVSALNDVILASRCIRKDICFDEASPYAPNTHKHNIYLALAKEINAKLLNLSNEKLPSILDLNKIGELAKKIVDDIVLDKDLDSTLEKFNTFGICIDITELQFLNNTNKQKTAILTQFNSQNKNQNSHPQKDEPSHKTVPELQLFF